MPKVVIADKLSDSARAVFEARGIEVDVAVGLSAEDLAPRLADAAGLAVRSATKATAELIAAAPQLKVIGRAGIGVDNIDLKAATERGVVVMNTPQGNAVTTAEHAIALLFAVARQLPAADRSTRASKWEKSRFMGVELTSKTLGLIGCGNIGAIVAEKALGLGMKVAAYDPFLSPERAADLGVERVDLPELLARADFITLHVPLTDQTRGMIDAAALAQTKRGVRLINCARGGLVVEADLKAAIESGQVAGAAFDVFEQEPARDNPLFELEEVVVTPHLGASTTEAQEKVAVEIAEQMSDYLLTGAVRNALNMPSLTAEQARRLTPYMTLVEQLGSFAGQLTRTGVGAIRLDYEGQVAELDCRPLTQAALMGFLRPMLDSVNHVNAAVLARQRGIEVSEATHDRASNYASLVRLTVETERRQRSVAGTLFGGEKPRIVEIKDIAVEAELAAHMLYVTNDDRPGFIGAIGALLGDAGVNIATFHLGRAQAGGEAIALIGLDQPLSEELLAQVRALPHIQQATPLTF
ncbi:MAG: phosphoglycerate dehydrogenase [Rhodospirillales bacterium]